MRSKSLTSLFMALILPGMMIKTVAIPKSRGGSIFWLVVRRLSLECSFEVFFLIPVNRQFII